MIRLIVALATATALQVAPRGAMSRADALRLLGSSAILASRSSPAAAGRRAPRRLALPCFRAELPLEPSAG